MQRAPAHAALRRAARALLALALCAAALPVAAAHGPASQPLRDAICVDGGMSGRPFAGVNCVRTVATIEEGAKSVGDVRLVVVRAFASDDKYSIDGMGTYRDPAISTAKFAGTVQQPVVVEAEGFDPNGGYVQPIVSGGLRVTGAWTRTPGTAFTWQTPWEDTPGSFQHSACVDRIWVSRLPGKTRLADFPLTRPLPNQGNDHASDCADNTYFGGPMTPQHVDAFPGSYEWLDNTLYVHLPGGEDPNQYTIEVPYRHSFSPVRGSSGLVVRGFRIYHTQNGIDLWHCGTGPDDRCEATHNETSYNTHYGLQPGRYGLLAYNSGTLNTLQLIKITNDFAEIAYNRVGPQLAHGFKLNDVRDCVVHHNEVYGNVFEGVPGGTQAGWRIVGTRDAIAGIYLKNGTQRCRVYSNFVHHNRIGILLRNDGDTLTEGNRLEANAVVYNQYAIAWRDDGLWTYNTSTGNIFDWAARFRWGDATGPLQAYETATGLNPAR